MSDREIRDPIAALDQALRGMKDWAHTLHTYYSDLVASGFTPAEAMTLVVSFQQIALLQHLAADGEDA